MVDKIEVGRVAFRHEGRWWNAYWAAPDTMEGATLLGSILMTMVEDKAAKEAFMDTMRLGINNGFDVTLGEKPKWKKPERAPESERGGNA